MTAFFLLLFLGPASAQPADEEIVVYGQLAVLKARDAIVHDMEDLGYRAKLKDDRVVFRPPDSWMGKATLYDDGRITFSTPLVALQGVAYQGSLSRDLEANPNMARDGQTGSGGVGLTVAPEKKKLESVRERVRAAVQNDLDHYVTVLRRTAIEGTLAELPDRLDALWEAGVPLKKSDVALTTPESRRRAVLEHWATRTETWEGGRACKAIEAWLAAVVQESEHPITEAERAEFEARRSDDRRLP